MVQHAVLNVGCDELKVQIVPPASNLGRASQISRDRGAMGMTVSRVSQASGKASELLGFAQRQPDMSQDVLIVCNERGATLYSWLPSSDFEVLIGPRGEPLLKSWFARLHLDAERIESLWSRDVNALPRKLAL